MAKGNHVPLAAHSIRLTGLVAGLASLALAGPPAFTFTTINDPSGISAPYTIAVGINDAGQIAGSYTAAGMIGVPHGFLYRGGAFTSFDNPLATGGTTGTAINNAGQIIGSYGDAGGSRAFLYSGGTFTTIDYPSTKCKRSGLRHQ